MCYAAAQLLHNKTCKFFVRYVRLFNILHSNEVIKHTANVPVAEPTKCNGLNNRLKVEK